MGDKVEQILQYLDWLEKDFDTELRYVDGKIHEEAKAKVELIQHLRTWIQYL